MKANRVRRLARGLYTKNLDEPLEDYVRHRLWEIVAKLYEEPLLDGRTALQHGLANDGCIFVITSKDRDTVLPGLTIYARRGHQPLSDDTRTSNGIYIPSPARALIENMVPSRASSRRIARTYSQDEIEAYLEAYLGRYGEDGLTRLRDQVRSVGQQLAMTEDAEKLDQIIGALLVENNALPEVAGRTDRGKLRIDADRVVLFEKLFKALHEFIPADRPVSAIKPASNELSAFYEAYFSNFIEGIKFDIDEARDIVFANKFPEGHREDAQDLIGTWQVISDAAGMSAYPANFDAFLRQLRTDHASVMQGRSGKNPGVFKAKANMAGGYEFVSPEKVAGTLKEGFAMLSQLKGGFRRGVFAMFLISEVHPFDDGNGRVARIAMNRELSAANQARIIIPTVCRDTYLAALRSISRMGNATALIRMLDFAQLWTFEVLWQDWAETRSILEACHAFLEPDEANERYLRLERPR
ncbi:Fic family protein [Thalassospira xiamenensis]|uniref:Fic family protein n=1 Tax=Thalassospira xiamenensis TaxID=220697 RepID=UPI0015F01EC1|nr:Fic family protein [Thalassospira xiamenensis]